MNVKNGKLGCLIFMVIAGLNASVGAWSIYTILGWFGKTIPGFGAFILGLIAGQVTIPIAIIGKLLSLIS